jgi:methylenetetrahydrofolate dehydrogenase (NADP+)/methenyltetrahydrofolate cyclohydrolase
MIILDGKQTANEYLEQIGKKVNSYVKQGLRKPHLVAILVGENPASEAYVKNKMKACEKASFQSTLIQYAADISEQTLLDEIHKLNENQEVDGFIVQLPLPSHISEEKITFAIDPQKDVDGFHPLNIGLMTLDKGGYIPATPLGIQLLIEKYKIDTRGKKVVIIGRSNIVGTPLSILLSRNKQGANATVTLTHSNTENIEEETKKADIIIAAIGKAKFLKRSMVQPGAIIIDVGINRIESDTSASGFALCGDVDYDDLAPVVNAITPVPGGVGPMTVCALLFNTLKSYENHYVNQ